MACEFRKEHIVKQDDGSTKIVGECTPLCTFCQFDKAEFQGKFCPIWNAFKCNSNSK